MVEAVRKVVFGLNGIPAYKLPLWTLNATSTVVKEQQHQAVDLWDDCGNRAGSALLLIVLRPLVFGVRACPPLRTFGVPPQEWMLRMVSSGRDPRSGHGPDNARADVVEALLAA